LPKSCHLKNYGGNKIVFLINSYSGTDDNQILLSQIYKININITLTHNMQNLVNHAGYTVHSNIVGGDISP